jgi:hypothetical protein
MRYTPSELLRELVNRVLASHDTSALDSCLDPSFQLWCNGSAYDLAGFRGRLTAALAGGGEYAVDFDDHAWVAAADRVAARLWVSSGPTDAAPSDSEVLVVATVNGDRFDRAWVLAWPDRPQIHHLDDSSASNGVADQPN